MLKKNHRKHICDLSDLTFRRSDKTLKFHDETFKSHIVSCFVNYIFTFGILFVFRLYTFTMHEYNHNYKYLIMSFTLNFIRDPHRWPLVGPVLVITWVITSSEGRIVGKSIASIHSSVQLLYNWESSPLAIGHWMPFCIRPCCRIEGWGCGQQCRCSGQCEIDPRFWMRKGSHLVGMSDHVCKLADITGAGFETCHSLRYSGRS